MQITQPLSAIDEYKSFRFWSTTKKKTRGRNFVYAEATDLWILFMHKSWWSGGLEGKKHGVHGLFAPELKVWTGETTANNGNMVEAMLTQKGRENIKVIKFVW